jgi:purine-binding chemotaxis protein CheW
MIHADTSALSENKKNTQALPDNKDKRSHQYIVFRIGQEEYALHIDMIKEVVLTPTISKVPMAPSFIRGVANIRGNILAIIDLEERLGIRHDTAVQHSNYYTLVIESDEYKMGILVKEVPNTVSITEDTIDNSPNIIHNSGADMSYIKGIAKVGARMIILVDIFKIISQEDVSNSVNNNSVTL